GTVETFDESYITAAKRELAEESGITHVISARYLCSWDSGFQNQAWHFFLCECADLADSWTFHTQDDGGHDFAFFWHDIGSDISSQAHTVFQNALEKVRKLIDQGVV
ncbi:NUDIX hydrolase, partial [Vibrio parahaemolyticus]|uniref:DNA mismatch repair protein MutT n=1 Tax=Vibrio parahaemolyticus TaxID=670 RepID=UPI00226A88CE